MLGPELEVHEVIPALPEIVHVKVPVGPTALPEPTTVATIKAVPPSTEAPVAVNETVGVAAETSVEFVDIVSPTGLYEESPGKAKVAE